MHIFRMSMTQSHLFLHISCMGAELFPYLDGGEIDDPDYGETTGASLRTWVAQHAQVLQHRWK